MASQSLKKPNNQCAAWEQLYRESTLLWRLQANPDLVRYTSLVPQGAVLDLGMGEGGNLLYFAQLGYQAIGVDFAPTAVARVRVFAKEMSLTLATHRADIRDFPIQVVSYALIISDMSLQSLSKKQGKDCIERMIAGLQPNGLLFISAFAEDGPPRDTQRDRRQKNSVQRVCSYTREELVALCQTLRTISCTQGRFLDVSHGSAHYHNIVTYLGQRSQS
jgi:SAM-dependent methyltransferase